MKKTFLATIAAALIASTAAPALAAQGGGQSKGDGPRHGPRIERMMERFDANRDGAVLLEEVSAHRLATFESADTDKNGSLSKDELKAFGEMRKEMRQQNREERRAERQGKMDGERMGKHGDRDGRMAGKHDGKRHGEGKRHGGDNRAERHGGPRMERLDADKNGEISLEEFTSLDARMFERFDRNGDKKIDVTDFYRSAAADNN